MPFDPPVLPLPPVEPLPPVDALPYNEPKSPRFESGVVNAPLPVVPPKSEVSGSVPVVPPVVSVGVLGSGLVPPVVPPVPSPESEPASDTIKFTPPFISPVCAFLSLAEYEPAVVYTCCV